MSIGGEDILRIEHKLDVIIQYLCGLNIKGAPAPDMPKLIPGMGGMTDGKCPITLTPIHYHVDPISGLAKRSDGLKSGMTDTSPYKGVPSTSSTSVMLTGNFTETSDD
jgi:hypothetical protein